MRNALVSVILPVFNAEKYLSQAIESILEQSYTHFELLILNDGSSDRSVEIIQSYSDSRIRFHDSRQNTGLVSQLNKGLQHSAGQYIARMDADDIALPNRLKDQVDFLEQNPSVGLCGCFVVAFDDRKEYFKSLLPATHDEICAFLLFGSPFFHPSIMIRKSVLTENKIVYATGTDSSEDYYLFVDLHDKTRLANVPGVGLRYRLHASNMSKTHGDFQKRAGELKRREYVKEFFWGTEEREISGLVEKHFSTCAKKILSVGDFAELLTWLKYLASVNGKKKQYDPKSFRTGISHFVYRKLINDKMTRMGVLRFWLTHYPGLFFALPKAYKVLLTIRCLRLSLLSR